MATAYIPSTETQAQLDALATHIFENHGEEIGNAAINKNFTTSILDKRGSKKVEEGGLSFNQPVLIQENSNFGFGSQYDDIDANIQDHTREFKFDPKVYRGTIVINQLHAAMNDGKSAIKKLLKTLRLQADATIANDINTALWTASPSAIQPESIRSIVSETPTAGTLGGITRSGNSYAQNGLYSTAISDIGSEAGLAALMAQQINMGGDVKTSPDIAVTTNTLFTGLSGYLDTLRRFESDGDMAKLGFLNIKVGTATFGYDAQCPASRVFYLNSNHFFMQILRDMNFKFEPFSRKGNNLNSTSIFYVAYNLTTNLPSALKVLTNVSTS